MEPEVGYAMDYIRDQGDHMQADEYLTFLEELIIELGVECDIARADVDD